MDRAIGIDYGKRRIGLATSDLLGIIATPKGFIEAEKDHHATALKLQKQLAEYSPLKHIVLGLPLHLDGKESDMSQEVRAFAKILEEVFDVPIILWDERLSSRQVERALTEMQFNRKERAKRSDAHAAAAILQNHLDHDAHKRTCC